MLKNKKTKSLLVYCLITVFLVVFAAGCGQKTAQTQPPVPQEDKRDVIAKNGVVSAAHPLAAKAGLEVLQKGGNAIDAAIAASFALNVVEPNASGMGGGGFAVVYIAKEKKSYVIDYRETAPAKATPDMYPLDDKGKIIGNASQVGYKAVAVPGQLRGMEMLHQKFSTMKWDELIQPAINLSEAGLPVTANLSGIIMDNADRLQKAPSWGWMQKILYKDGLPMQAGDTVKNPELTESLKKVAKGGADVFYKGEIADKIVKEFEKGGKWITKEDLASYKAIMRDPVIGNYRGHTLVTLPPASSGGLALVEMLNILEGYDLKKMGPDSPDRYHAIIEAQKLAFADRGKYMADPAFTDVPMAGLTDKKYAEERRKLIDPQKTNGKMQYGNPKSGSASTTSFSVVDKEGNMVTITQTINYFFGAGVVPEGTGIFMNDEMDDFEANPKSVNAPEPGKRPLSSITPVLVVKDGKPVFTVGTPGATRIITTIANIIVNVIDYNMDLQSAIVAPRFHNPNNETTDVEGRISKDILQNLEARGHKFNVKKDLDPFFGGAHGVMLKDDGTLHGGADTRRLGVAVGY